MDADFLLLMAGVVKSGVCSKARCVVDIGRLRIWCNFSARLLYVEDYQDKGAADVVGMSDRPAQASTITQWVLSMRVGMYHAFKRLDVLADAALKNLS